MDSRQDNEQYTLEAVRAALSSGDLTREEMISRLKGAIEVEESKAYGESDRKLIVLYGRILYELETGKEYVSRKDEALRQVKGRLAADAQRKERLRPVKRVAVVLAAMLVLVTGVEVFLHREWLFGKPNEDGQQYIIQGGSIDPGLVAEGLANADDSFERINTKNLDHAIMVMGYTPTLPKWVPEGWVIQSYYARRSETMCWFVASYVNQSSDSLLKYEERLFYSAERANAEIEQNEKGNLRITDGKSLYFAANTTVPLCVWSNDLTLYTITGPINEEQIIEMVNKLKE